MKSRKMKRIVSGNIGIQQGSRVLFSDFATDGPMWTGSGDRETRHKIGFGEAFRDVPAVTAGISLWDTDHATNLRADLTVEHVTVSGFDLVFRTWGDTRIARLRVDWMAIGAMRDDDDWDVG